MHWTKNLAAIVVVGLIAGTAQAEMFITEWMYNPGPWEFIEFTNVGPGSVDMTGWSYDDADRTPGAVDLSDFGIVAAGESVVLTEAATAADFRTEFLLPATVKVIAGNTNNLGRSDEINLYDNNDLLVDRLTYGDQTFPGTIRTQNPSGVPISHFALGTNDVSLWKLSALGDEYGSYLSESFMLANPGTYTAIVPEPGAMLLMVVGVAGLGFARRRSKVSASCLPITTPQIS
jgi:predicted extracellular nuclease